MATNKFRREAHHYRPGTEPYRPLTRDDRARILFLAEALDRRTRRPGQHGGVLKHSGIAVLKALLCRYANLETGRCDPSADAIAIAANVSRSTVFEALKRLEAAGLVDRFQRLKTFRRNGILHTEQTTNAYTFNFPHATRPDEGDLAAPLLRWGAQRAKARANPESRYPTGTNTFLYKSTNQTDELSTARHF
jgi:DNA-binding MarR family transcriptional regulator